jgi:hypothetical protein
LIHQQALFRDQIVVDCVNEMLKRMQLRTSDRFPSEQDVLKKLLLRGDADIALPLVTFLMDLFGAAPSKPKDARFDKNRRALAKKKLKGPKGAGIEA